MSTAAQQPQTLTAVQTPPHVALSRNGTVDIRMDQQRTGMNMHEGMTAEEAIEAASMARTHVFKRGQDGSIHCSDIRLALIKHLNIRSQEVSMRGVVHLNIW